MATVTRCEVCHRSVRWVATPRGGIRSTDLNTSRAGTVVIEDVADDPMIVGRCSRNGFTYHVDTCPEMPR